MSGTRHIAVATRSVRQRTSVLAGTAVLFAVLPILVGMTSGCTGARAKPAQAPRPIAEPAEAEAEEKKQPEEKRQPEEARSKGAEPQAEQRDEEDSVLARIAAAPEYLWKGLA